MRESVIIGWVRLLWRGCFCCALQTNVKGVNLTQNAATWKKWVLKIKQTNKQKKKSLLTAFYFSFIFRPAVEHTLFGSICSQNLTSSPPSGSFCGLARSYDSYQWHEKPDLEVNNTNLLSSSKWAVTRALNMSCLQGMAPAQIYLHTMGLTVSSSQETSLFFPLLMNCNLSRPFFALHLWM